MYQVIDLQNEMNRSRIRADELMAQFDKAERKIEQFWADEPNQGREWSYTRDLVCSDNLPIF